MSNIPLLSKTSVPTLHSPRRGPQAVCLCMLVSLVLILVSSISFPVLVENTTQTNHVTRGVRTKPPQAELLRVIKASTQHEAVTEDTLRDLLSTVSYFAKRELHPR